MDHLDHQIISTFRKASVPLSRIGIATIYIWFGSLKVIGYSPAAPLVKALFERTIPVMPFEAFLVLFGLSEVLIGVLFLLKPYTRIAIPLLFMHMVTTLMPLILVPQVSWQAFLVPTLEGQYIIKNIVVIATALTVGAHLVPLDTVKHMRHQHKK